MLEVTGRFAIELLYVLNTKLLEQMRHMANKQVLLDVLEKFISPYINLTPHDAEDPDGNIVGLFEGEM